MRSFFLSVLCLLFLQPASAQLQGGVSLDDANTIRRVRRQATLDDMQWRIMKARIQRQQQMMQQPTLLQEQPSLAQPQQQPYNLEAQRGEIPIGVLGVRVAETEKGVLIRTVFPESDFVQQGIHAGDYLVSVAGQPVTTEREVQDLGRGDPGTKVKVEVFHRGLIYLLEITRIDSRSVAHRDAYFKQWAQRTQQW